MITANRIRSSAPSGAIYLYGTGTNVTFSGETHNIGNAYNSSSLTEYPGISGTGGYTVIDTAIVNETLGTTSSSEFLRPDVKTVMQDVFIPDMTEGSPAPGKRVRQTTPQYQGTAAYHCLYLPTDWQPGHKYPVFVDYPGNGPFRNRYADRSGGMPESPPTGFGISGGKGFIVIGMPYVNSNNNMAPTGSWWGNVQSTIDYCIKTVQYVCDNYGGDPCSVILTGFSRSAVGTGFIGRYTDAISDLWLAFISYDGWDDEDYILNNTYNYPNSSYNYDTADFNYQGAVIRFERIAGRANFILNAGWTNRAEVLNVNYNFPFTTYVNIYRNHNATWCLRGTAECAVIRNWVQSVLRDRPGIHSLSGKVTDMRGNNAADVNITKSDSFLAITDANGNYKFERLIAYNSTITPSKSGYSFLPPQRQISVMNADRENVDWACKPGVFEHLDFLKVFTPHWLENNIQDINGQSICTYTSPADEDGDGKVDFKDFAVLSNAIQPVVITTSNLIPPATLIAAASDYLISGVQPLYAVNGAGMAGDSHTNGTPVGNMWMSLNSNLPKWFKVDLAATYRLNSMKIWNFNLTNYTSRGCKQVDIYYSASAADPGNPVANPDNWTVFGTPGVFELTQAPGASDYGTTNPVKPDQINLMGIRARWISLKINSHYGGSYCGLSEIQFLGESMAFPDCWNCPTQCHGDSDCDTDIDYYDLTAFCESFGEQYPSDNYNPCSDFNRDGMVNTQDWAPLRDNVGKFPVGDCTPGGTWPPLVP